MPGPKAWGSRHVEGIGILRLVWFDIGGFHWFSCFVYSIYQGHIFVQKVAYGGDEDQGKMLGDQPAMKRTNMLLNSSLQPTLCNGVAV